MDKFTWNDDYSVAFAPTDDPRVLAVIQRDDDAGAPDGDAYAPAYYESDHMRRAGSTFWDSDSDAIAEAYKSARRFFVNWHYGRKDRHRQLDYDTLTERFLRIFHGVRELQIVDSSVHQGYRAVIFDTPGWREHCGIPADVENALSGDVETWSAFMDGYVYGVGYAVNEARVMDDGEPIDLDDGNWDVEVQCWGLYGEKYAKEEALTFNYGSPDLPQMLPISQEVSQS